MSTVKIFLEFSCAPCGAANARLCALVWSKCQCSRGPPRLWTHPSLLAGAFIHVVFMQVLPRELSNLRRRKPCRRNK